MVNHGLAAFYSSLTLNFVHDGIVLCLSHLFVSLKWHVWSLKWPQSVISQRNKTLQKPSSSATPFDILTTYSVLTMWTLEIASAWFTRQNWNLRTHPHHLLKQGSQIRQIWCILRQNCSDDSTEVTEGVTLTPEIFGNKQGATLTPEIFGYEHSFVLTFFATNTIYINCKRCKP